MILALIVCGAGGTAGKYNINEVMIYYYCLLAYKYCSYIEGFLHRYVLN